MCKLRFNLATILLMDTMFFLNYILDGYGLFSVEFSMFIVTFMIVGVVITATFALTIWRMYSWRIKYQDYRQSIEAMVKMMFQDSLLAIVHACNDIVSPRRPLTHAEVLKIITERRKLNNGLKPSR